MMIAAAKAARATIMESAFHRFEPQGVSGTVILAESHLSIHTWPEKGYAAMDFYTCGDHTDPWLACEHAAQALARDERARDRVQARNREERRRVHARAQPQSRRARADARSADYFNRHHQQLSAFRSADSAGLLRLPSNSCRSTVTALSSEVRTISMRLSHDSAGVVAAASCARAGSLRAAAASFRRRQAPASASSGSTTRCHKPMPAIMQLRSH